MTAPLSFTFLGTGTSQGVPVIGCDCIVCQSNNPKDKRLRTAALVRSSTTHVVIDAGPDFRQQMLRENMGRLDGILITHEHNDHVMGLDDVRPFNFRQQIDMPIYASPKVQSELRHRFAYAFGDNPYPGAPRFDLRNLSEQEEVLIGDIMFQPILVDHGWIPVMGFRIGSLAYITDMKTITAKEQAKLEGVDVLIVNALHHKPHYSHLNIEEAIAFAKAIGARKTWFVHMSHLMGLQDTMNQQLPEGMQLAWDQLTLYLNNGQWNISHS